ncbi:putative ribonuclease H-like domain-containing protein, partial [Tanacetum coccineum]
MLVMMNHNLSSDAGKKDDEGVNKESGIDDQEIPRNITQDVNATRPSINTASINVNTGSLNINIVSPIVTTALLEAIHADFFGDETAIDMSNITATYLVPSTPNTRIHKDHSLDHAIGRAQKGNLSIKRSKMDRSYARGASAVQVTTGLDLGGFTTWQKSHCQEEGIDYDEVFAPVARIEAIRLFLAYASFKDFVVYQMDVKSAFLYSKIEEEVYVCQPLGFENPEFPDRVYKVEKRGQIDKTLFIKRVKSDILLVQVYVDDIIFGSTKKNLCTEFEKLMHKKFQMSFMGELTFFLGLQVTQKDDGIFISQDKEVWVFNCEDSKYIHGDFKSHCSRMQKLKIFQVTPKVSHLHDAKRIFRYLKGQPKLGLWYPKDSPFDLEAYSDSDYAGASLDRKSTTGCCYFLRSILISLQCKKQTIVANSTTEVEYVAAASCCGQVLWIQNQMLDYEYNFMNTKIFIDNESTIYTVKNLVFHSKTKHIEIRHHFIRDSNKKKLIQKIKIHIDPNVADLLTKAFDFWATAKAKTINGEVQIQALVDGKKVIVTETSVRIAAEGTECLLNATIFEQMTLMGAKTIAWNEFSSTIASVVICLATNQKFNFSKYIFDNMVKNLKGGVKFLMYPRFVQVFLDKQVKGMSKHKEIYVTPFHTKKVFANMKREGKGFSGRVTPLFQTMMVQAQEEGEGSEMPTVPQHTSPINQPSSSQPPKKQKPRKTKKQNTEVSQPSDPTELMADETEIMESVPTHSNDPLLSGEDRLKLNELMELCISLSQRVISLETTKTNQALEIDNLKGESRSWKGGISLGAQKDASKQGRKINDLDADAEEVEVEKAVSTTEVTTVGATTTTVDKLTLAQTLIEIKAAKPKAVITAATTTTTAITSPKAKGVVVQEPKEGKLAKQREEDANIAEWDNVQAMINADYELAARLQAQELRAEEQRRKPPTKAQKRNQMYTYLKNMAGFTHSQLKNKSFDEVQKAFDKTMGWIDSFVSKDSEVVKGELEQERIKKQKIDDDQEEAEMKKHIEIVVDEEEIAVDAIPLATKPPIIIDWKIIKEGKMGYFQLIRADGSS